MSAAYPSELAKKLNLKAGMTMHVIGRPAEVDLGDLPLAPEGAAEGVLLFAVTGAEVKAEAAPVVAAAKKDRLAWIAYPKAGQRGTDLNRDILWRQMQDMGVDAVRQVSIDSVWSAIRFRPAK